MSETTETRQAHRKKDPAETEIEAAKNRLRRAMADASPSRLIERHPLRAAGIALALGVTLGFSRAARGSVAMLADMAVMTSGRAALRTLDLLGGQKKKD